LLKCLLIFVNVFGLGYIISYHFPERNVRAVVELNNDDDDAARPDIGYLISMWIIRSNYVILSYSYIRFYLFFFYYLFLIQNVLIHFIHTPCCERNVIRVSYYSIKLQFKGVLSLCRWVCHLIKLWFLPVNNSWAIYLHDCTELHSNTYRKGICC